MLPMNTNTAINGLPPDATLAERYAKIQREMPCLDNKVLINPASKASFEEVQEEHLGALERLSAYINNGHSTEGLPFSYASVQVFA